MNISNDMADFFVRNHNITLIHAAVFVPGGSGEIVHRNRPSSGIAFQVEGTNTYTFENTKIRTLILNPNGVLFFPKGSTYTIQRSPAVSSCYAINFDTAEDITDPFVCYPDNGSQILNAFQCAEKSWSRKCVGYYEQVAAKLMQIIYLLKQSASANYLPQSRVRLLEPAINYIHLNFSNETIYIKHMAALCGMSDGYFRRVFFDVYHVTPKKYIDTLRLEKARELLNSGEYRINSISGLCGFTNDSYFSKKFKEYYSVSPSQYSKA